MPPPFRPGSRSSAAAKKRKKRRAAEPTRFRSSEVRATDIDWKDLGLLQRLISTQGKLFSRKRTGLTAECQRKVSLALKRARYMGLMPYVT